MDRQRTGYIVYYHLWLVLLLSEILICYLSHLALKNFCRMQIPTDLRFWILPILVFQYHHKCTNLSNRDQSGNMRNGYRT